jgi:hypothetical protein
LNSDWKNRTAGMNELQNWKKEKQVILDPKQQKKTAFGLPPR